MRTVSIAGVLIGIFVIGASLQVSGCQSKPVETQNTKGGVAFPNTGRPPTKEEMAKILATQQRRGTPPGPPATKP